MAFIRHPKDFFAGLIFIAFGLAAIIIGSNYSLGSAARMGPGYFPRILGILLLVLGSALSLRALKIKGDPIPRWPWKPMLIVLGSVIAFGVLVNYIGLVLATIGLVFCSSAASHEFRPREALVSGVLLATLAVGVFIYGLSLQLPTWPWSN
jgi:putative tricarboxylic transport membrane protein